MRRALCAGAGLALLLAAPAAAQGLVLPGDPETRRDARARLEALSLNLRSYPSATAVLRVWCEDYGLAPEPQIRAVRVEGVAKPLTPQDRAILRARPDEDVRYRRVRLTCGDRVLSEADNWYRPSQLTAEMNQTLEETDIPFGTVASPLRFQRRTLGIRRLFQPLEARRWFRRGSEPLVVPPFVLEHRALLTKPDGEPFSLVVESYTGQVLAGRLRPDAESAADAFPPPTPEDVEPRGQPAAGR